MNLPSYEAVHMTLDYPSTSMQYERFNAKSTVKMDISIFTVDFALNLMESRLGHANKMIFLLKITSKKHHQNILKKSLNFLLFCCLNSALVTFYSLFSVPHCAKTIGIMLHVPGGFLYK